MLETKDVSDKEQTTILNDILKHGLVLLGALSILFTKEYVSAKLLAGLVLLDYMSTGYISKLPLSLCFLIFMALTTIAVI